MPDPHSPPERRITASLSGLRRHALGAWRRQAQAPILCVCAGSGHSRHAVQFKATMRPPSAGNVTREAQNGARTTATR